MHFDWFGSAHHKSAQCKPKGFAHPMVLIIIILLILAGGIWYFRSSQNLTPKNPDQINKTEETHSNNWKTYNGGQYNFTLNYPQNWTLVPLAPDVLPGLKPENDPKYDQQYYSELQIRPACSDPSVETMPFDIWIKTKGNEEVQGYNTVKSFEPLTTDSGVQAYKVIWNTILVGIPTGSTGTSQVVYIKLPKAIEGNNCIEFNFDDQKYDLDNNQIIKTFRFN